MNNRVIILCSAALSILSLGASAQDVIAVPPIAQAPAPTPGQHVPATKMRVPGSPGETPVLGARPDLGKWWKNSDIAKEIGLSEQQVTQIEQTFFDHRLKLIDLQADVQRNEARLQPLVESDQLDEAKISAQMDQLLAARSRLEKANMMMMISIRKVLSVDQWKKLEEIREDRQRGPFKRVPGPPHYDDAPGRPAPRAQRPPEGPEQP